MVKEVLKKEDEKRFTAKFSFPESWKAHHERVEVGAGNDEKIIQWALDHGLHAEAVIRKATAAVIPTESQELLFPEWQNETLQKCKDSTGKYWLWIFLLDDLLEKCSREEVNKMSVQFMTHERSNKVLDHNSNAYLNLNSDSAIMSFINSYAELVDDFCDNLKELHSNAKPEEILHWRQRLALGQFQYFYSTAEEVNKVEHVSTESDYLLYRSLGSAVAVYCLFVEAKNGIFDTSELPKEFLLRLNQLYSVLSCFIGLVNDGFSYHREKDMDHVFNIIKFCNDHGYVDSEEEGYGRLNTVLDLAYKYTDELMASFSEEYSHVKGVEGLIKDLKFGAVGFVNIHLNLKRYRAGPFTSTVTFVNNDISREETKSSLNQADDLPNFRTIFNLIDVQNLWGNSQTEYKYCPEYITEKIKEDSVWTENSSDLADLFRKNEHKCLRRTRSSSIKAIGRSNSIKNVRRSNSIKIVGRGN